MAFRCASCWAKVYLNRGNHEDQSQNQLPDNGFVHSHCTRAFGANALSMRRGRVCVKEGMFLNCLKPKAYLKMLRWFWQVFATCMGRRRGSSLTLRYYLCRRSFKEPPSGILSEMTCYRSVLPPVMQGLTKSCL